MNLLNPEGYTSCSWGESSKIKAILWSGTGFFVFNLLRNCWAGKPLLWTIPLDYLKYYIFREQQRAYIIVQVKLCYPKEYAPPVSRNWFFSDGSWTRGQFELATDEPEAAAGSSEAARVSEKERRSAKRAKTQAARRSTVLAIERAQPDLKDELVHGILYAYCVPLSAPHHTTPHHTTPHHLLLLQ